MKKSVRERQRLSLEELAQQAEYARAFESPLVQSFLDYQEERLFHEWRNSQNPEEREKLFLQTQGLAAFREYIEHVKISGTEAQKELNKKYEREAKLN